MAMRLRCANMGHMGEIQNRLLAEVGRADEPGGVAWLKEHLKATPAPKPEVERLDPKPLD